MGRSIPCFPTQTACGIITSWGPSQHELYQLFQILISTSEVSAHLFLHLLVTELCCSRKKYFLKQNVRLQKVLEWELLEAQNINWSKGGLVKFAEDLSSTAS